MPTPIWYIGSCTLLCFGTRGEELRDDMKNWCSVVSRPSFSFVLLESLVFENPQHGCVHGYAFFTMTASFDATGHDTAWHEHSSSESDSELAPVELTTAS